VRDLEEGYDSFFQERLAELRETVLLYDFGRFSRQISKYVDSLPELLFHKDKIVEILITNLQTAPSIRKHLLRYTQQL
jgi:U3 small nucleolar RNA-associated protein 20